ncbi:unnamed protein product [Ectocarpus sp. 4 AP-2014]
MKSPENARTLIFREPFWFPADSPKLLKPSPGSTHLITQPTLTLPSRLLHQTTMKFTTTMIAALGFMIASSMSAFVLPSATLALWGMTPVSAAFTTGFSSSMDEGVETAKDTVDDVGSKSKDALDEGKNAAADLKAGAQDVSCSAGDSAKSAKDTVEDEATRAAEATKDKAGSAAGTAKSAAESAASGAKSAAGSAASWVKGAADSVAGGVVKGADKVKGALSSDEM